jgi:hypothetical protein
MKNSGTLLLFEKLASALRVVGDHEEFYTPSERHGRPQTSHVIAADNRVNPSGIEH